MSSAPKTEEEPKRSRFSIGLLAPFILFALLAALFLFGLRAGDPSKLPSALIGKPVPDFSLKPLEGLRQDGKQVPGFSNADLNKGNLTIVNVWASWCIPCRAEHPYLVRLTKQSGVPLYGLNYKDPTGAARRFLGRYGNPYKAVGVDDNGRTAIEWGVYGVPETFIISGDGKILHKHVGPIDGKDIKERLMPVIEKAQAKN